MVYRGLRPRLHLARPAGALVLVLTSIVAVFGSPKPAAALNSVIQIAQGGQTTCAIVAGGDAYCWGDNTYGQFGDGTTTSSAIPVLVSGGHTWASISVYAQDSPFFLTASTCGVTTTGVGYCWGLNDTEQVGDNTNTQRLTPTLVSGSHTWRSISAGLDDTCGVTTTNVAYCWGMNNNGEDGDGGGSSNWIPTLVSGGLSWSEISEGAFHTCGVTTTNVGYCWGYNAFGQLGIGASGADQGTPQLVSGSWSHLSAGDHDTCGVTTTGVGYCWGENYQGADGDGNTGVENDSPSLVSGAQTWSQISQGGGSSCGLTTAGIAYCWGEGAEGELGNGSTSTYFDTPQAVTGGHTFTAISTLHDSNGSAACGLTADGIVYCWGYNGTSQLGNGLTANSDVPVEASMLFSSFANTNLSVTITPTFTFTIGNRASACNGESGFVAGAGTASTVAFGNLAAGANVSGGQALTVTGNSGGGFAVYIAGTQAANNLRSSAPAHNWTDVSGTYASPAVLGPGEQFGYTYHDSTASTAVTNPASANLIALTNTNEAVMGSTSSESGTGCVSFDAQTSASTPAASYTATVIYTAVPTF